MTRIQSLQIQAFRQLKDMSFEDLRRINLLVGENSSGKTSVLEAIALFCRPMDPLELLNVARRREIKSSRERILDGVRWLFPQTAGAETDHYFRGSISVAGTGTDHTEIKILYQGLVGDVNKQPLLFSHEDSEPIDDETSAPFPNEGNETRRGAEIEMSSKTKQLSLFDQVPEQRLMKFQLWEDERYISRGTGESYCIPVITLSPVSHRVELIQSRQLSEATLSGDKLSVF